MTDDSSDYGSIKELGFVQKVIDKTLFCMKPRARLGVFFLVTILQEIVGLITETSTIWLMIKTGSAVEAYLLFGAKEFRLEYSFSLQFQHFVVGSFSMVESFLTSSPKLFYR